jgi:hypothetical protein|tara:strand:- start:239 stop:394 length:156 start_codon:yes stop_codon:yes gene_type:complete
MSKKDVKLYPPSGGSDYIIPHPSKVEQMKQNGWVEKPVTKTMSKEKSHGKS